MTHYIVGFSKKTHFFARAIMWFTKSEFSHCYIIQEGAQGKYVLEANSRGVNLQTYDVFLADGAIVQKEYRVEHDSKKMGAAWAKICTHRLNRPYSYMQIIGDAVVIALQALTGRSLPNPFSQRKKDVCSELVLAWLRRAEIEGFDSLRASTVSPEDLDLILLDDEAFTLLKRKDEEESP